MKKGKTKASVQETTKSKNHGLMEKIQPGKMYVGLLFDYLLIGGGLSLVFCFGLWFYFGRAPVENVNYAVSFAALLLLSSYAHFAASTVRLYTKPKAFEMAPFLTMVFPAITVGVLVLGIIFADSLGYHLSRLYTTWSSYHFAAQAYGIAIIYLYRSGCQLSVMQKKWLWIACMVTFLKTLISDPDRALGIWWLLSPALLESSSAASTVFKISVLIVDIAAFGVPLVVFAILIFRDRLRIPGIAILVILTNVVWFTIFPLIKAVALTTIFHAIQYLAIVTIFHVKDQKLQPGNTHGTLWHALTFNVVCVLLGYALFRIWPEAFVIAGLGYVESALVVAAVLNIHHFIVDGFIWKLRSDSNTRIVGAA